MHLCFSVQYAVMLDKVIRSLTWLSDLAKGRL
jgi:hypothetical protein